MKKYENGLKTQLKACASVVAITVLTAGSAHAIDEITVTAQQREQSLSDVPVAVSAFDEEMLKELGTARPGDLMKVTPGLSGRNVGGTFVAYAIRGITSNVTTVDAEASVGVFLDGMYIGRFGGGASALFDTERVEVLKGPQSTMFGRNSSAGAINIISNKPTEELSVNGELRFGERNTREAEVVFNLPVAEKLGLRVAAMSSDTDGWAKYALTGRPAFDDSVRATRVSLAFEPTDAVTLDIAADYEKSSLDSPVFPIADNPALFTALTPTGTFDDIIYTNVEDEHNVEIFGVRGRLVVELDSGYQFESFTGYRAFDHSEPFDFDGTQYPATDFTNWTGNESFLQDFRLRRTTEKADWFVGVSYWNENAYVDSEISFNEIYYYGGYGGVPFNACAALSPVPIPTACFDGMQTELFFQRSDTEAYSIYGDVIYAVSERVNVSFGLRISQEEKSIANKALPLILNGAAFPTFGQMFDGANIGLGGGPFTKFPFDENLNKTFDSVQPRLAIDINLNEDHMVYASVGRGFKAGGFNLPIVAADRQTFGEESSWSYEIGNKSTVFNGHGLWNTAVYYYEYDDYQDSTTQDPEVTPFVTNAATVIGYGIETDLTADLSESTQLLLSASWNSTEYDKYDDQIVCGAACFLDVSYAGNRLPYTPEYSVSVGLRNEHQVGDVGVLNSFINYAYNSDVFFNRTNTRGEDGYGLLSGRLDFTPNGASWSIGLYGDNILDEEYRTTEGKIVGAAAAKVGRPRTIGLSFRFEM